MPAKHERIVQDDNVTVVACLDAVYVAAFVLILFAGTRQASNSWQKHSSVHRLWNVVSINIT